MEKSPSVESLFFTNQLPGPPCDAMNALTLATFRRTKKSRMHQQFVSTTKQFQTFTKCLTIPINLSRPANDRRERLLWKFKYEINDTQWWVTCRWAIYANEAMSSYLLLISRQLPPWICSGETTETVRPGRRRRAVMNIKIVISLKSCH